MSPLGLVVFVVSLGLPVTGMVWRHLKQVRREQAAFLERDHFNQWESQIKQMEASDG